MAAQLSPSRTLDDTVLLVGRVALGAIFVESGLGQLMALGNLATMLASRGVPLPSIFAVAAMAVELIGGILIILGYRTRLATPPVMLFMIVATLLSHRYWELADAARRGQEIHFFKNVSVIGGLLLMFVAGPGRFSLDAWVGRARVGSPAAP